MPPCPGNSFPESLTPMERLIRDSQRSPSVENTETTIERPIQVYKFGPLKTSLNQYEITHATIIQSPSPPQKPSHDFFGEIRSKRRLLPIRVPTQNAPVSFNQMKINNASNIIGLDT